MSKNVTLMGASYSDVPSVILPRTGGGNAQFFDVSDTTAAAADVATGKYFYTSAGVRTQGTSSGGGGGGLTLLHSESLGHIETSSTTATDLSHNITVSGINDYDLLIVETSVDTKVNSRHLATVCVILIAGTSSVETKNQQSLATARINFKAASSGAVSSRVGTTAYGIYAQAVQSIGNDAITWNMYRKYNSTSTGTINGDYTCRVYGVKLVDLIGG